MTASERSAELARGWIEAWIRMDMDWLRRRLAPGFVHVSPFGRFEDRESYLAAVEPMARKSVVELRVKDVIASGSQAVVRFENRTARGVVETCDWVRIEEGRIKEIRSFYDSATIREILSPEDQATLYSAREEVGMSTAREEIGRVNRRVMDAFGRGDASAVAKLYTADGQLLPVGSGVVSGQGAITAFWDAAMEGGIQGVDLETAELEDHGDTAIEVGRYTLRGGDQQVVDNGKYLVIWKKDGEGWKLHRDIWTTDRTQ